MTFLDAQCWESMTKISFSSDKSLDIQVYYSRTFMLSLIWLKRQFYAQLIFPNLHYKRLSGQ